MNFVALDCETHLIQPGLQAPPIVCGSYWNAQTGGLLTRREFIDSVRSKLQATSSLPVRTLPSTSAAWWPQSLTCCPRLRQVRARRGLGREHRDDAPPHR